MNNNIRKCTKPILILWIISVFCYLPIISKGLTNTFDGLWSSTYYQAGNWELSIGRWAWLFLDKLRGGYAAEPFNSLLTLLLIAAAVYIAIGMFMTFEYKSYIYSMLALCSTTVCCYLSYRYMSPTFGLSVLLVTIAAWFITRDSDTKKKRILFFIVATSAVVISLGLYQANLGCFCVLVILTMIKMVYQEETKKCYTVFFRALICGIASCILYKIAWDICLKVRHVIPSDYNGANSLSIMGMVRALPKSLVRIYYYWYIQFSHPTGNYVFKPIRVVLFGIIFAVTIIIGVKKLHGLVKNLILYMLLLMLLPVGTFIFIILAPDSIGVLPQMTFPVMFVIPLILSFLSEMDARIDRSLCFFGILILYGNVYAVGTDIDAMAQGSNSCYAIMNNVVTSLNDQELLSGEYKYAFYGNIAASELFKKNKLYDMANGYAKVGTLMKNPDMVHKTCIGLVEDIGIDLEIVDNDQYYEIFNSGILDDMDAFPNEGSIIENDGIVIVKISGDYKTGK